MHRRWAPSFVRPVGFSRSLSSEGCQNEPSKCCATCTHKWDLGHRNSPFFPYSGWLSSSSAQSSRDRGASVSQRGPNRIWLRAVACACSYFGIYLARALIFQHQTSLRINDLKNTLMRHSNPFGGREGECGFLCIPAVSALHFTGYRGYSAVGETNTVCARCHRAKTVKIDWDTFLMYQTPVSGIESYGNLAPYKRKEKTMTNYHLKSGWLMRPSHWLPFSSYGFSSSNSNVHFAFTCRTLLHACSQRHCSLMSLTKFYFRAEIMRVDSFI